MHAQMLLDPPPYLLPTCAHLRLRTSKAIPGNIEGKILMNLLFVNGRSVPSLQALILIDGTQTFDLASPALVPLALGCNLKGLTFGSLSPLFVPILGR